MDKFHLFVSAMEGCWDSAFFEFMECRCLKANMYTSASLAVDFSSITQEQITSFLEYPCVFAYEKGIKRDARVGWLTQIRTKDDIVRVDFELEPDYPALSNDVLVALKWDLDIDERELPRTHWALKNRDLSAALTSLGYPSIGLGVIDITTQMFDIALSFPGEVRDYVRQVAGNLARRIGMQNVFYDDFYKAQLARPNLDTALQDLYRKRSRLIVVFLSKDYEAKTWCHVEFRAIREIINNKVDEMIMLVRLDDAEIPGICSHDGYIDARQYTPANVAEMATQRLGLIKKKLAQQGEAQVATPIEQPFQQKASDNADR